MRRDESIATGGQRITFDASASVDLDLYDEGNVGMTRLCTTRSGSWRRADRQVEIISRHADFSTCRTTPAPALLTVAWPALTALIDAGPLTAKATGSTLTIVDNNQPLTFHAATN